MALAGGDRVALGRAAARTAAAAPHEDVAGDGCAPHGRARDVRRARGLRQALAFRPKPASIGIQIATMKLGTVARITHTKKCR